MMASSERAITHHLVVLFCGCLKNQENQPIISPDATPCTRAHAHTSIRDMYTCKMHLHMHAHAHNFTRTSFEPHFSPDRPQECDVITAL